MKQEKAGEAVKLEAGRGGGRRGSIAHHPAAAGSWEVGGDNLAVRALTVQVHKKRTVQRAFGSHSL